MKRKSNSFEELFDLLDRYLIADLEVMVNLPAKPFGGLGYPTVASIVSAMELLGKLISGHRSKGAFNICWKYFVKDNPEYNDQPLEEIFREALRDGVAHLYLVKFGVQISKSGYGNLTKTENNELNVDLVDLYRAFKKTYENIKQELIENSEKYQAGYDSFIAEMNKPLKSINDYVANINLVPTTSYSNPSTPRQNSTTTYATTTSGVSSSLQNITRMPSEDLDRKKP